MFYGKKSVEEMDEYYGINADLDIIPDLCSSKKQKECKKIQNAFINHAIILTLAECKLLYETYSDENYCATWENGLETMKEENIFQMLLPWLLKILADKENRISILVEQLKINGYLDK